MFWKTTAIYTVLPSSAPVDSRQYPAYFVKMRNDFFGLIARKVGLVSANQTGKFPRIFADLPGAFHDARPASFARIARSPRNLSRWQRQQSWSLVNFSGACRCIFEDFPNLLQVAFDGFAFMRRGFAIETGEVVQNLASLYGQWGISDNINHHCLFTLTAPTPLQAGESALAPRPAPLASPRRPSKFRRSPDCKTAGCRRPSKCTVPAPRCTP